MMFQQPKQPTPISPETHAALTKKIAQLLHDREEAKKRLSIAREMGDLSENGAYKYAKFEISSLNRQLREIHEQLETSVVTKSKDAYDKVEFGCVVTLLFGGKEIEYTVVGTFEANPLDKKISLDGPLGKCIAGKKVGYTTDFETPKGTQQLEILAIHAKNPAVRG